MQFVFKQPVQPFDIAHWTPDHGNNDDFLHAGEYAYTQAQIKQTRIKSKHEQADDKSAL